MYKMKIYAENFLNYKLLSGSARLKSMFRPVFKEKKKKVSEESGNNSFFYLTLALVTVISVFLLNPGFLFILLSTLF